MAYDDTGFDNVTPLDVSKASRKMQLKAALVGLDDIKPNLTSNYIVKGWLDRGTASVAFGESNVGKSFFALDLGLHVAAGKPWHGSRVNAGTVVYIAAEGGSGFGNRIAALKSEKPELIEAAKGSFFVLPVTVDLCGANDAADIIGMVKDLAGDTALIIVDTLARSMGVGDENTSRDMGAFINNMGQLQDATGAHVMVIHHSGKDASRGARGSSVLRAAVDTEIALTCENEVIQAEATKQRDMVTGQVFAYRLQGVLLGHDQDGDAVTSCIVEPCEIPKKVVKISGAAKVALQAFGDALSECGEVKTGNLYPSNRQCVSLDKWREYCDRHSLTEGSSPSAIRTAFMRAKTTLQNAGILCVLDGFVWRCDE